MLQSSSCFFPSSNPPVFSSSSSLKFFLFIFVLHFLFFLSFFSDLPFFLSYLSCFLNLFFLVLHSCLSILLLFVMASVEICQNTLSCVCTVFLYATQVCNWEAPEGPYLWLFQQMSKSALFVVSSLYQKGASLRWKRLDSNIFQGISPQAPFSSPAVRRNSNYWSSDQRYQ